MLVHRLRRGPPLGQRVVFFWDDSFNSSFNLLKGVSDHRLDAVDGIFLTPGNTRTDARLVKTR